MKPSNQKNTKERNPLMKKSKIVSLILAVTLMMSAMLPMSQMNASAAGTASITINKPANLSIDGQTFSAYKIFDVTSAGTNYSYTLATKFAGFTDPHDDLTALAADPDSAAKTAAVMAIAADLWAYISATPVAADGSATAAGPDAASVTISGLDNGYYLVFGSGETADGTVVYGVANLTTTTSTVTITPKMDAPTLTKEVWDHNLKSGAGDWSDWTDINMGTDAQFRLTSAVPVMTGYKSYTFTVHDTMSAGLTLDESSFTVTVGGHSAAGDYTLNTAKTGTAPTDGCTFEIVFKPDVFVTYTAGDAILITYSAELNGSEDTVIGNPGNPNTVHLQYSNAPYTTTASNGGDTETTTPVTVIVYTFDINFYKYTGDLNADGTGGTGLANAEFNLKSDATGNLVQLIDLGSGNYRLATSTDDSNDVTTTLVSPAGGRFHVDGLDAGTYQLTETKAPAGYNAIAGWITGIKIVRDSADTAVPGGYYVTFNNVKTQSVNVQNNSGKEFPETGGIGTAIFYIAGAALTALLAVLFIVSRRKNVLNK